jgi:hypothetical protein
LTRFGRVTRCSSRWASGRSSKRLRRPPRHGLSALLEHVYIGCDDDSGEASKVSIVSNLPQTISDEPEITARDWLTLDGELVVEDPRMIRSSISAGVRFAIRTLRRRSAMRPNWFTPSERPPEHQRCVDDSERPFDPGTASALPPRGSQVRGIAAPTIYSATDAKRIDGFLRGRAAARGIADDEQRELILDGVRRAQCLFGGTDALERLQLWHPREEWWAVIRE